MSPGRKALRAFRPSKPEDIRPNWACGESSVMYCWNCGHKNPDDNKFCGACGKMQARPPVLVEADMINNNIKTTPLPSQPIGNDRRTGDVTKSTDAKKAAGDDEGVVTDKFREVRVEPPPGTGITPNVTPVRRYASTNPLIGETRAVKEAPLPSSAPTTAPPRVAPSESMRISGPSFLGLSDEASDSADYLLSEDEEGGQSSTARSYVFLALLLLFGVLIYKQWDTVSAVAHDLAQRANATAPSTIANHGAQTSDTQKAAPESPTKEVAANAAIPADKPESDHAAAADESAASEPVTNDEDAPQKEPSPAPSKPAASKKEAAVAEKQNSADPAAAPVVDDSQVDLAQKYLQGRGVAQDCNRGVSLLRSAAAQPNPKAQIKLGALYATGHCVSQDKAEAYRWFAEARQLQPGNQWIDKNLNSLWSEMSAQERARVQR